ncbi:MAG: bifunctional metallophosphatase/5'-nucleotidase [Clostridia bacterium]|nr:bifunctional metallophosphatase/5'-nucleotidase [Clostridia bacterium]
MKKLLGLLLALILVLSVSASFAEEAAAPGLQKDLIILYTSDVHCAVDEGWGYGGLYEVKDALSRENYVLLVDDGDAVQGEPIGTMTTGESLIDLMNAVGYDVAIPGNHEYDYGMDRFFELVEKAKFPYISCNFNKEGKLVFDPYIIFEFDGVKIAFVGVTTPMTPRSSTPKYFMNEAGEFIYGFLQDEDGTALYNAVQKAVDDARGEGAEYVVLLAHLGNEAEVSPWKFDEVVANTTGINAVLDGHSHDTIQAVVKNKEGEDVVRSACGTKFESIGALTIKKDGIVSSELYTWGSSISATKLLNIHNPVTESLAVETKELNDVLATVVAKTQYDLIISDPVAKTADGHAVRIIRNTETNLGDLCADAYLDQSGADIAFVNGGGIRVNIKKGDITMNDILKVHPYGNSLTVLEVSGQTVLDALEWSVHSLPGEFGGFNHVAGMTYEVDISVPSPCSSDANGMFTSIDDTKPRRIRNVVVGGEPIDPEKKSQLACHDYQHLDAGDGYTMYAGCPILQESVKLDNQVLIDYITGTLGGVVGEGYSEPYGQGRMVVVGQ